MITSALARGNYYGGGHHHYWPFSLFDALLGIIGLLTFLLVGYVALGLIGYVVGALVSAIRSVVEKMRREGGRRA
jgi:hypothetical protein